MYSFFISFIIISSEEKKTTAVICTKLFYVSYNL